MKDRSHLPRGDGLETKKRGPPLDHVVEDPALFVLSK